MLRAPFLYGTSGAEISKLLLGSGPLESVLTAPETLRQIAIDGGWIYYHLPSSGIWKVGVDGTSNLQVATTGGTFAVGPTKVYWIDGTTKISMTEK